MRYGSYRRSKRYMGYRGYLGNIGHWVDGNARRARPQPGLWLGKRGTPGVDKDHNQAVMVTQVI